MSEVWVRPNRRALGLAMVPVVAGGVLGWLLLLSDAKMLPGWLGPAAIILAGTLLAGLIRQIVQPRIAYRDGSVLFYLRAGGPIAVPLDVVEAFFQGQSLAHLPGEHRHQAKSINLIARLAQRSTDWHQREVKPALGLWEEGYITVRGTWCEPIDEDFLRQLNRRLNEVKREHQTDSSSEPPQ